MKKTIQQTTHDCDKCRKQVDYPDTCLNCGVEMCYECGGVHGKTYRHSTWAQGSGDGFYCNHCDSLLTRAGGDKLHRAYRAIQSLRDEANAWNIDFEKRREVAERTLRLAR